MCHFNFPFNAIGNFGCHLNFTQIIRRTSSIIAKYFYGYHLGIIAWQFQNVFSAFIISTSPTHSHNWSKVCKVISGFHSDAQKTSSFPNIMRNCIYVWHELVVKWRWNMFAYFHSHVSFWFLVQPCLNFGWQLKLPVANSGVIFSESMKIGRLFQFTLINCYLP